MFRRRFVPRHRLQWIIERFREAGATSPENAKTLRELGLPNRLDEAMDRPFISRLGIFVEVNGKHYLSEEKLRLLKDQAGITNKYQSISNEMVSCKYCNTLMPSSSVRCPNCSAPRTK